MQAKQSEYLRQVKPQLKTLITLLQPKADYVSILATDVSGQRYAVSQRQSQINDYVFGERGFVVRLYRQQGYQEFSFDAIDDVKAVAAEIIAALDRQQEMLDELKVAKLPTPLIQQEPAAGEFAAEVPASMYDIDAADVISRLRKLSDAGAAKENVVECQAAYTICYINKMFLSDNKDLTQAYAYSTSQYVMLGLKDGQTHMNYTSASGWYGPEILDTFMAKVETVYQDLMVLFDAANLIPGVYDVICPPEASGLIAHEAFGHGVEMDMFVKDRAIAKDCIGDTVASPITDMYDGASRQQQTASYFFDDEGTMCDRTKIIDQGILKRGMCDVMAAARLNTEPTGNGRRQSFEHKVYTRMTNTYFQPRNDKLEDMIASIKYGFVIDGASSGMEDPKHWGIQCVYSRAKEIKDGKLTGKVFSPVYMTGFVPDLLKSITMIGPDIELNGCGYCGKGYKEFVVVSTGGPYMKTKARLG